MARNPYKAMTRRSDPSTARAAAKSWTEKQLSEVQRRIEAILKAAGADGLTHEEQHDRYRAEWPTAESSPRKRCCDLKDRGLAHDSGRRRTMRSGRMGIVWVWGPATPTARKRDVPVVPPRKR